MLPSHQFTMGCIVNSIALISGFEGGVTNVQLNQKERDG